jgi:two-component system, LytTR family, sensor kinase
MKKSIVIFLHIGFWFCYSLIVFLFLGIVASNPATGDSSLMEIMHIIVGAFYLPPILTFYSFYLLLFPKYLLKKKILKLCLYGVFTCILASLAGVIAANIMLSNSVAIQGITIAMIPALMAGVVGLVIRGFIAWYNDIKLKQELKEKNYEMEMALVKAQLDPHFLFNTLNNIDVLIQKDADEASKYLKKLSDIMRFMLFETKTEKIQLSNEIAYLEKYIALQKIRSSNLNFVRLTINGDYQDKKISPMVFIPFIENAFKHVSDKKAENAIDINLIIEAGKIQFECTNNSNTKPNSINEYNGLGNELIQKRLNLLYPNSHNLTVKNEANFYTVILIIDYD